MSPDAHSSKISADKELGHSTPGAAGALSPTAMTLAQAARVLAASGSRLTTIETLRRDIDTGAPVNGDGTVNLVHYAAWLAKEMGHRGD